MGARVQLEEADALVDVLRIPVDGRRRDAGEVVRMYVGLAVKGLNGAWPSS